MESYVITIIVALIQAILVISLAPLFGGITRKIRAKMHGRQGAGILQEYYDIAKLWHRSEMCEGQAGIISRIMPPIYLGTILILSAGLPLLIQTSPVMFLGDIITVLYMLALPRFMFSLASIDSGATYSALGGIRELIVGVLVEPALILSLLVLALSFGTTNIGYISYSIGSFFSIPLEQSMANYPVVSVIVAGIACAIACYIEMGKVPFDLAEAEQELQEGPLAGYSGPSLAMLKLGIEAKQVVIASLFIAIFIPWGAAQSFEISAIVIGFVTYLIKLFVVMMISNCIENAVMRVRYKFLGRYTWIVTGIAIMALVFVIVGI